MSKSVKRLVEEAKAGTKKDASSAKDHEVCLDLVDRGLADLQTVPGFCESLRLML